MTQPLMNAFSFWVQRFQFESANETEYRLGNTFMQLCAFLLKIPEEPDSLDQDQICVSLC